MKKTTFILVFMLCINSASLKAQSPTPMQYLRQQNILTNNTPEAYFHLSDSIMQLEYGMDSSEGGLMNGYRRWKQFFETRCAPVFDSIDITQPYYDALINARTRGGNGCGEDQFRGTWENIGPRTDDANIQNQGWVTAIWSEPGVPLHIIIGTLGAGVWKTTNGGTSWENITDKTMPLGTFGVQSMTVNPNDYDDIYISAQMFAKAPLGADHLGMGIWHTTDGGATAWTLETIPVNPCMPSSPRILSNAVQFCPYLVGGQTYVVTTITNVCDAEEVYGKLGTGPWMQLTTAGNVNGWNCRHFTDIEFMPDNPGKFLIASKWPLQWMLNPGVYTIHFNPTTGAPAAPNVTTLVTESLNGNPALFCGNATGRALSFSVEYMGSGTIYMAYNWGYGSCTINGEYRTNVAEFNYNTPTTITNLATDIIAPFQFHDIGFEAASTNAMYLTLNQAFMIYKDGNVWKWNALSAYGGDLVFHADLRSIHIGHAQFSNDPGSADIVFWGNDGGISRTWNHDMAVYAIPNNASLNPASRDVLNLNGANLYLGNLWGADKEPLGRAYSASGWDNGTHYYNKAVNTWTSSEPGDGLDGNFDKRMSNATDYTLIDHIWSSVRQHNNPGPAYNAGNFVGQPEPMNNYWRPHPMQYRKDIMNMGQIRAWQSNPATNVNPYFNGLVGSPNFNLNDPPNNGPNKEIRKRWQVNRLFCKQFMVTPSDDNRAYYLFFGAKKEALLNRGVLSGNPAKWDWVSGGVQGADITPNQIKTLGFPGTDFCVDDKNPDRIFLALGGINAVDPIVDRVLFSEDGGATWDDMSNGLTMLPVNCLVYQNGSNDVIYAGTDDGVYYWDATLGCWIKMNMSKIPNETIPNIMVTKLSINYCTRKLVAATFGRGIWESDLYFPNFFPDPTEVISSNTTWNANRIVEGSVLVQTGNTLTITGTPNANNNTQTTSTTTIFMPKYGKIIVEKGARLVVQGARITNECGGTWMGIFANGNGQAYQQQLPGSYLYPNHGLVEITDAIIENAEEALNNGGGSDNPNTGGVLRVFRSHFINNHRSVAFYEYHNQWGALLKPDNSFIKNSRFDVDDDARIPFYAHISLWGVRGIKIDLNIFNNTQTLSTTIPDHSWAVYSIDAGYGFVNNTVNNMYKGLEASNFNLDEPLHLALLTNTFDGNEIGIHLRNMTYPHILGNTINIGAKQTFNTLPNGYFSLGTKMEFVNNFKYVDNTLNKLYPSPSSQIFQYTAGTEVYYTGDIDEQIHRNHYMGGLLIGNDANFQCGLPPNGLVGLRFTCNTNDGNELYDFVFQEDAIISKTQFGNALGVATNNTFSNNATVSNWHHISGLISNAPVTYEHQLIANHTPTLNPLNVILQDRPAGVCSTMNTFALAKLENNNYEELSPAELSSLKTQFTTNETNYNTYKTLYLQLIDEGNTEALVEEINNATIANQLITRTEFLALSPYVSQTALRELALQEIVSNPILLEILIANPDATRDESFIEFLELEMSNPLPAYMIDLIRASWSGSQTARTSLEQNISFSHNQMSLLKNHIIYTYRLNDTLQNEDSACIWMQKVPGIRNTYELIEYYLAKGNILASDSLLDSLGVRFKLTAKDSVERSAYIQLYTFKKSLLEDSLKINQLDSARIATLSLIANAQHYTFPRSMARNALCFFYQICYPDSMKELPNSASNRVAPLSQKLDKFKEITVYPNPANEYVVCYYNLVSKSNEAEMFLVSDVTGKQVYKAVLKGAHGQHIWDTRNVGNGNYIYTVITSSGEKYSGKVMIQK